MAAARVKWHRTDAYYRQSRWRGTRALDGGGALINQAIHTIDLLLWCLGPVRRVFGRIATALHPIEAEDTAVAVVEFVNGALATVEATTAAYPGYARRLELTGSEGTVVLEGDRLVNVDLRGVEAAARMDDRSQESVSAASPVVADASAHQRVFEDFIRAVSTRTAPACDGAGGRVSVAVKISSRTSSVRGLRRARRPRRGGLTPGSDPCGSRHKLADFPQVLRDPPGVAAYCRSAATRGSDAGVRPRVRPYNCDGR